MSRHSEVIRRDLKPVTFPTQPERYQKNNQPTNEPTHLPTTPLIFLLAPLGSTIVRLIILSKTEGAFAPGAKLDSGAAAAANDRRAVVVALFPDAVRIIRLNVKRRAMVLFRYFCCLLAPSNSRKPISR